MSTKDSSGNRSTESAASVSSSLSSDEKLGPCTAHTLVACGPSGNGTRGDSGTISTSSDLFGPWNVARNSACRSGSPGGNSTHTSSFA